MAEDMAVIQSQLDDIKGAIFVIVDRLATLSNRLDSSVSDLERLSKQMAASQAKPPVSVDSHYPQVQERLSAIAAIEQEMLESMRQNAEMVKLVGETQVAMRTREDELAKALTLVAGHLAELSAKIDSQSKTPSQSPSPQSITVANVNAPQVATALTLMAQKLDEHLKQQAKQHDAIADMVASIAESTTVRQRLEDASVAVQEDALPTPPAPPASTEPVVETATITSSTPSLPESSSASESESNDAKSTEISFGGSELPEPPKPPEEELPEPPAPPQERERRLYKSKLPWE